MVVDEICQKFTVPGVPKWGEISILFKGLLHHLKVFEVVYQSINKVSCASFGRSASISTLMPI